MASYYNRIINTLKKSKDTLLNKNSYEMYLQNKYRHKVDRFTSFPYILGCDPLPK